MNQVTLVSFLVLLFNAVALIVSTNAYVLVALGLAFIRETRFLQESLADGKTRLQ